MKQRILHIFFIATCLMAACFMAGCANTSGGPTGGPKDTIPPVIVGLEPLSILNFPTIKGKIAITFNEYVQLKNPNSEVLISPPIKKRPDIKIKSKTIFTTFTKDTLRPEQTYTLNFGGAISDVNEGNAFPNYVFTFSTGNQIDSMLLSGTVMDYATLLPQKGVTVALYLEPKDSSVVKELPVALSKTDDWGYFCIRGLKRKAYTVFAFEDKNHNNLYDKGGEIGGFFQKEITPTVVATDSLPQVKQLDMKDTLECLARPSEMDIYTFKEKADNQYLSNSGRVSERECFLKFNAPGVVIDTFLIKGIYNDKLIKQFNPEGDSLTFWINERRKLADTLLLKLSYLKTDSLGELKPQSELLKLVAPFDKKKVEKYQRKPRQTQTYEQSLNSSLDSKNGKGNLSNKFRDEFEQDKKEEKAKSQQVIKREDLLDFSLKAEGESVENLGIEFKFKVPLIKAAFDSIKFTSTTPRQITSAVKFHIVRDSTDILHYTMISDIPYKVGNEYRLFIPTATFTDINSFTNDSTETKFSLPTNDRLSSITLEIKGVKEGKYLVELVSEKRDKVFLKYEVTEDKSLLFPYLTAGHYSFRITEDKNKNGKLDIGNILKRTPPEKARLLKLPDGKTLLDLKEQTDLTQSVDLESLFEEEK